MHTRSRRSLLVIATFALALGACTPGGSTASPNATAAVPSSGPATHRPTTEPSARPTSKPTSKPKPTPTSNVSQSDTEWGRIWDALPVGFPRYPGATTADDATADPVSAAYAVAGGDAAEIASWLQTKLEQATYSTEGLSGPYEDGSLVLDSVGNGDCRIQTKIAPQGSLILVTVLYGAACPA